MAQTATARLASRRAKGAHPHFFDDANIDRLVTMVMLLAEEVSVLRERLETHEHVAAAKGAFTPEDIEGFKASDDVNDARDAWRKKFIDRLIQPLEQEYDRGLD
ncbi:MAG: hypothetical protein KDE14_05405 [Rhodobacteraceae bacterium]|nr:hypothetical protein [Paracoccaceae bacterium]